MKDTYGLGMYTDPPPLRFGTRATLEGHQLHKGSRGSDWKQGKCQENPQKPGSGTVPTPSPPRTQSYKAVKQVALPW